MHIKFDRSNGLVQDIRRLLVAEVAEEAQANRITVTRGQCSYHSLQLAATFDTFNY